MGKPKKSGGSKSRKPQNATRSITPEVFVDNQAGNLLNFQKPQYRGVGKDNKARNRAIDRQRGLTGPSKVKKPRKYTEKELGIPKLNTALQPVGVKVKGKKGKKFVDDDKMQLILAEVQQLARDDTASKLERARQVEAIREHKRKEMEDREREQKEKLERKKKDVKKPHKKASEAENSGDIRKSKHRTKKVAFAV